ncbi:MAG: hypothetical protein H7Z11_02745 [Verrucomicrobia bacterium]|nr:hypothetical protein [Leptolyngbya sp. ES-bin-22]
MDELQARFRAIRSLPTDMNLAKQPYPEFEHLEDGQRQGEANVVELSSRQADASPSDALPAQRTAKRKQGSVAKRKPETAQKAFPFRQLRDGHQQPYIDEFKRLEAQAERINQLLAERKRKKAQADPAGALTDGDSLPPAALASKKKATRGSRKTPRSPEVSPMPAPDDDTEALEAQAERINQLLKALETALVESEAMPHSGTIAPGIADEQVQTSHPAAAAAQATPAVGDEVFASGTYRHGANARPFAANQQHVTHSTDQQAQHEATETAQALRYLASRDLGREQVDPSIAGTSQTGGRRSRDRGRPPRTVQGSLPTRRYGLQLRRFLHMPQKPFDKVGDAVLWIVLAAAIRVGARFLLAMVPALTPVFVLLMFAPAALAVYLAMFVPRAGFVSIYRLFLIMLGLLLGGRL